VKCAPFSFFNAFWINPFHTFSEKRVVAKPGTEWNGREWNEEYFKGI
jgi:hypothetical protein